MLALSVENVHEDLDGPGNRSVMNWSSTPPRLNPSLVLTGVSVTVSHGATGVFLYPNGTHSVLAYVDGRARETAVLDADTGLWYAQVPLADKERLQWEGDWWESDSITGTITNGEQIHNSTFITTMCEVRG
jgi:hypothetical protein